MIFLNEKLHQILILVSSSYYLLAVIQDFPDFYNQDNKKRLLLDIDNLTTMSYHPRVSIEEPLKNSQKVNKLQIPNSSYLKSFKKSVGHTNASKPKTDISQRSQGSDENNRTPKLRQKTQIAQKNKNQLQQFQYMMQQTDNSMEQLLNSSINQFEKLIIHEDSGESLEQQNYRLKNALSKMKNILKDKLQTALQKQKQQLSKMLEDYISLITKLLQDKEQLTIKIQDIMDQNQRKIKHMEFEFGQKLRVMAQERDQQIGSTKNQIEQFLKVIEQYEEQAKAEQNKFNQMEQKIEELQQERQCLIRQLEKGGVSDHDESYQHETQLKIEAQSTKIQTLLQLLQKSQQQNNELKSQFTQLKTKQSHRGDSFQIAELKNNYERRLTQLEQEHEQQFLQYEKAIKDTLAKKDECIDRLNLIIQGLRERKSAH